MTEAQIDRKTTMTDKERFEAVFSEEYRAMKQKQADAGNVDVTELMWMVWQHASHQR